LSRLAEFRKKKKLTQKELAKTLKLSQSAIAMYEIGRRRPSLDKAKKIAEYFNVSIEDIFFENKNY